MALPTLGPGHPGIPDGPWKFIETYTKSAFSHIGVITSCLGWFVDLVVVVVVVGFTTNK